jgi:hypothetical protein
MIGDGHVRTLSASGLGPVVKETDGSRAILGPMRAVSKAIFTFASLDRTTYRVRPQNDYVASLDL